MAIRESKFERKVVNRLMRDYPGAYVIKTYPGFVPQGFPDRVFLYYDFWSAFDAKRSPNAPIQPNQPYYIDQLNQMSHAAFVNPENEEVYYNEIQRALQSKGY